MQHRAPLRQDPVADELSACRTWRWLLVPPSALSACLFYAALVKTGNSGTTLMCFIVTATLSVWAGLNDARTDELERGLPRR